MTTAFVVVIGLGGCYSVFRCNTIEQHHISRLQAEDVEKARDAAKELAELKSVRAVPLLIESLGNSSFTPVPPGLKHGFYVTTDRNRPLLRYFCVANDMRCDDCVDFCLQLGPRNRGRRYWKGVWAGHALIKIGKVALPAIISEIKWKRTSDGLSKKPDADFRERLKRFWLVTTFVQFGDDAVQSLIPYLHVAEDRAWALKMLQCVGPEAKSAVPELLQLLKSQPLDLELVLLALAAIGPNAKEAVADIENVYNNANVPQRLRCFAGGALREITRKDFSSHEIKAEASS